MTPERVTIFTDAQAAIRRMASYEPGPGQQYALQARKHIAALRKARPGITIEIWWCPAHKGIAGNEKADEPSKIAAEEPDTHGVEWLNYSDRTEVRAMALPRSLTNLQREISEKKRVEERQWAGGRTSKTKYRTPKEAGWHGSWEYQEACLAVLLDQDGALPIRAVPLLDGEPGHPAVLVVPVPDTDPGLPIQGVPRVESAAEYPVGGGGKETGSWKSRWSIRDPWRTRGAAGRCWTFSLLQTWEREYQPRRSRHCFSLRPPSWHPRTRRRGWDELPFVHLLRSPPCGQRTGNASYIIPPWPR